VAKHRFELLRLVFDVEPARHLSSLTQIATARNTFESAASTFRPNLNMYVSVLDPLLFYLGVTNNMTDLLFSPIPSLYAIILPWSLDFILDLPLIEICALEEKRVRHLISIRTAEVTGFCSPRRLLATGHLR